MFCRDSHTACSLPPFSVDARRLFSMRWRHYFDDPDVSIVATMPRRPLMPDYDTSLLLFLFYVFFISAPIAADEPA